MNEKNAYKQMMNRRQALQYISSGAVGAAAVFYGMDRAHASENRSAEGRESLEAVLIRLEDESAIRELANKFADFADIKDAKSQGELFLSDGILEFQMGMEGELKNIIGRNALVKAFAATINPCKAVYHINGQHVITLSDDKAEGIAYCQASLVRNQAGKDMITIHDVRYTDHYQKVNGKWYIQKRRTTFLISETHELKK